MKFAELHCHSTYSTGRSIGSAADIVNRAKELDLHSVSITDTRTIAGILDFYKTGKEKKFPVCLGTEIFVTDDIHDDKRPSGSLVLIAKTQTGYQNLCKLITVSNEVGRRLSDGPTVNIEDIREHSADLICLTSNATGFIAKSFFVDALPSAVQKASKRLANLTSIFKEDLYLELSFNDERFEYIFEGDEGKFVQRFEYNPQHYVNKFLIAYSKKFNLPLVFTSDAHMQRVDQKILQDIVISNTMRGKLYNEARYMLSIEDIKQKCASDFQYISEDILKQCCENSIAAAGKCSSIELKFKSQIVNYPHILHPLGDQNKSKIQLALDIVKQNGRVDFNNSVYKERLAYELKAICYNGKVDLIDYFLVLEDLCRWCRDSGVIVGPGRGSGAGSLLNYAFKITHLDPIKNSLLFERFISEGRIQKGTLPDIDLDFSDQEAARSYLIEKYGDDRVKPIGVFQTLRLKNAVKDSFKALHPSVDFMTVNKVTSALPKQEQGESELEYYARSLNESKPFAELLDKYSNVKDSVGKLVGFNRQAGIHPCAVAISQDPLNEFVPLRLLKDKWSLEFDADDATFSGIIKYDILSLTTLKYWQTCLNLIKERTGEYLDVYSFPIDDYLTLKAFERGDTESVFQFNSEVAKAILTQITVNSVDDLSLVTSVGRPGPMQNAQHHEFIKRKNKKAAIEAPHWSLNETLKHSYGIMIYQEGVMKAAQILGGFTLAEADDIRKAMGKKNIEYIKPYKDRFIEFASEFYGHEDKYDDMAVDQLANEGRYFDISPQRASEIWQLMETFSGYGFNLAHSMSYALIGYICQYFKVHYPLEWWTACLTHASEEHLSSYYSTAKKLIRLPDINLSTNKYFIAEDNLIQMPFDVIKGIGENANIEVNSKRPFTSFEDFFNKVNKTKVNKRVVLQLIAAGAFDSIEPGSKIELINKYYQLRKEKLPEELQELTDRKVVRMQFDALSFIVPDYYSMYADDFSPNDTQVVRNFSDFKKGVHDRDPEVLWIVGGEVTDFKVRQTKAKEGRGGVVIPSRPWAKLKFENKGESIEVVLWPSEWTMYEKFIKKGVALRVSGRVQYYGDAVQLYAIHIKPLV